MVVSDPLRELVNERPHIESLRRQAVADGMQPLRLAGALHVAAGRTVLEEVLSATPSLDIDRR